MLGKRLKSSSQVQKNAISNLKRRELHLNYLLIVKQKKWLPMEYKEITCLVSFIKIFQELWQLF